MTRRAKFARISLVLSLLAVLWLAIAMFGARAGLWKPLTGFSTMTMSAMRPIGEALPLPMLPTFLGALALAALVATLVRAPRTGWFAALVALAIPAAIFAGLLGLRSQAESVPFIHDVATDTADPPAFSEAMLARREADEALNPLHPYDVPLDTLEQWQGQDSVKGKTLAQLIAEGYPKLDLTTLTSDAEPAVALKAIERAMETRGFADIALDEEAGRVEGTAVVFWYGFRDDVVGRVRPGEDGGSVIDFRSVSRVGLSDLGVNAERVADLRAGVSDILSNDRLRRELFWEDEEVVEVEEAATDEATTEETADSETE